MNKVSCSLLRQQVVYWEDDTKPDTVGKVRISGNFSQVNVSGLRPSTAYYLSVAAFNTAGPGPQSPPINATTKEPRESTRSPRTPDPDPPPLLAEVQCDRRESFCLEETTNSLSEEDQCEDARWVGRAGTRGSATKPRLSPSAPGQLKMQRSQVIKKCGKKVNWKRSVFLRKHLHGSTFTATFKE